MEQPRAASDMPLDRNESYWLLDNDLLAETKNYDARALSTYPDYDELKATLASYAGVRPDQICLTPGSDAVIECIARELVGKGNEALLPVPTFYGYESILDRAGCVITPIAYTEKDGTFVFPKDAVIKEAEKETARALFLCNPNNPLGACTSRETLQEMVEKVPASLLIISDEAYFEYSGFTLLDHLQQMPNLIIIRTMSKGFGIPGARIGYCIAEPLLIKQLEKALLPWPIAHTSLFTAIALLRNETKVKARRDEVIAARDSFIKSLEQIGGIIVYPSETNFVLIRALNAKGIVDSLARQGIRVVLAEHMSRFPEAQELLRSTIRIAIPSPADTPLVLKALREALLENSG